MSRVMVQLNRTFTVSGLDGDLLDKHTDLVIQELLKQEAFCGLFDSTVSADLGKRVVEIDVCAEADSFEDAVALADSCIRTAIHAAGGHTHDWRTTSTQAELVPA